MSVPTSEVAVLIAVTGTEDLKSGFSVFFGDFILPPRIRNIADAAINENMYDTSTATPACSAPFIISVAEFTSTMPATVMTASSANSITL